MEIAITVIWFVLTAVFLVLEFKLDKYVLPFAMGAGVAGVSTFLSLPVLGQLIAFAVVTALAYALFRPDKPDKAQRRPRDHGRGDW